MNGLPRNPTTNFPKKCPPNSRNIWLALPTPVSYTHLDVYKRQAIYFAQKAGNTGGEIRHTEIRNGATVQNGDHDENGGENNQKGEENHED